MSDRRLLHVYISISCLAGFICHFSLRGQDASGLKYLTEKRTWTSSDGRTLEGRLVLPESGNESGAIVNGIVRISVNGTVYDLPMGRLSTEDQLLVKRLVENPKMEEAAPVTALFPKELSAKLVSRTFEGKFLYRNHYSHVFPSFAEPHVVVDGLNLSGGAADASDAFRATMTFTGSFRSDLALALAASDLRLFPGRLYVNGEEKAAAVFPLEGPSTAGPEGMTGTFKATIENVAITEGLNVLHIAIPDPITRIEGFETITFQFDPSGSTFGEVKNLGRSRGGEQYPYFIIMEKVPPAESAGLQLEVGAPNSGAVFDLLQVSESGAMLVVNPGKPDAAGFCLLPSRRASDKGRIAALKAAFDFIDASGELDERDQWLSGYTRGLFVHGADLVFADGRVLEKAAELSDDARTLKLKCRWIRDGARSDEFHVDLTPPLKENGAAANGSSGSHEMLWQIARRYREKDSRIDDIPLAMLSGDLSKIGLDEIRLSGWGEEFFMKIAEPLHDVNMELASSSPFSHGVLVGMIVAAAAQVDLPPLPDGDADPEPVARPMKSEIIAHLLEVL